MIVETMKAPEAIAPIMAIMAKIQLVMTALLGFRTVGD